jgi:hypothetical protein
MDTKEELQQLTSAGIITSDQAEQIYAYQHSPTAPTDHAGLRKSPFSLDKILYYLGGYLIVFAIVYFLSTNWDTMGDFGRIVSSSILIAFFGGIGMYLRPKPYKIPCSLFLLAGVIAIPVLIYSIELALGWWPPSYQYTSNNFLDQHWLGKMNVSWVILDSITITITAIIFYLIGDPLLSLPVSHFFWYLVLDITNLWIKSYADKDIVIKSWVTVGAGALMVAWGTWHHFRRDKLVGMWQWIYGLGIISGAMLLLRYDTAQHLHALYQTLILGFALVTLILSYPLKSKTFLFYGAAAVFYIIQDITWTYFKNSLGFSIVLVLSGLITIGFGILIQRYYKKQFGIV